MTNTNPNENRPLRGHRSIMQTLRDLPRPDKEHDFQDALRLAERQATEFLRISGHANHTAAVPSTIVTGLPRVRVVYETITESGMSQYVGGVWLIVINSADHLTRQRFTLMHEFKHILDHHDGKSLYTGRPWLTGTERTADAAKQRERAADYFAGCVLMPKTAMLRLWANGVRKPEDFAAHFDVSPAAARVRLEQVGLTRPSWMCTRGLRTPVDGETRPAFDRAVQEAVEKMRALGLRTPGTGRDGGRPSMRRTARSRTLRGPYPRAARRFV